MAALRMTARLNNRIADIAISGTNLIALTPVQGQWPGCNTQQAADDRGAILAIGISGAMLDAWRTPQAYNVTASPHGGFTVSVPLNIAGAHQSEVHICLPNAITDADARTKAKNVLYETARDTVALYPSQLVHLAFEPQAPMWPEWGKEVQNRWVWW